MLRAPNLIERLEGLDEEEAGLVAKLNAAMVQLDGLRAIEIVVSEHFARSKIAWKLATYQHVLLHRIVSLFDGASLAWNHRATLSAMLAARALMETVAVFIALVEQTETRLGLEDLEGLNALGQRGIFASRDADWLKGAPDYQAVNVLNYIDRVDKLAPGHRRHYDSLSERCHPNMMGHHYMFAELDRADGTVRFADERRPEANQTLFLGGIILVGLVEPRMAQLDRLIVQVADLQHRLGPVSNDG